MIRYFYTIKITKNFKNGLIPAQVTVVRLYLKQSEKTLPRTGRPIEQKPVINMGVTSFMINARSHSEALLTVNILF